VWLLALAVFWLPLHFVVGVPFWLFALGYLGGGVLLFFRPVQRVLLARLLGARRPTRQERSILDPAWRVVTQAAHTQPGRYILSVLPAEEVNAFASGGHLVVVTTYALEVLPQAELEGVLAHELSHHLGLHTVALTVAQWLSLPIIVLARIGFFFRSVAQAATETFARRSAGLTTLGNIVGGLINAVAWLFLVGILTTNAIANVVGRNSEFQADRRVVRLGYGPELGAALERFVTSGLSDHQTSWWQRLLTSHPPARTRIAKIDNLLRAQYERQRFLEEDWS
jgi:Zn-dependent protease with chaperone function